MDSWESAYRAAGMDDVWRGARLIDLMLKEGGEGLTPEEQDELRQLKEALQEREGGIDMNKYKLTITVEAENAVTGYDIACEKAELEGDLLVLNNMRYNAVLHRLLNVVLTAVRHYELYS